MTLKALKPKETDFELKTLGEHVKWRRLERKLTQKDAAKLIGASAWTVLNWETGHTEPPITFIPAILNFLGYNPYPEPRTLAERLAAKRRILGWSVKAAARRVGVDEATWARWERETSYPSGRHGALIDGFLSAPSTAEYWKGSTDG